MLSKDRRVERELKQAKALTDKQIQAELRFNEKALQAKLKAGDKFLACYKVIDVARPTLWRGHRAIARGDESGWKDVFDYCQTCIVAYERAGMRSSSAAGTLAPALLLRLAVHGWSASLTKICKELDAALKRIRGDERNDVQLAYFASFVAELMARGDAKPRGPKGALYRLAEHAVGKLSEKVLKDVCEFQLKNTGATEADDVEFVNFELIPVWWFALARLRKDRGLDTPEPGHPLFSTPFAKLPQGFKYDPAKCPMLKLIDSIDQGRA